MSEVFENFAVISGNASDELKGEIKFVNDETYNRYNKIKTAHHDWIDKLEEGQYKESINKIRYSKSIYDKISEKFPNTKIINVTEGDEIYWAVSPKGAGHSDRSLVDCHYDSPFSWIPTGGVIYYRVIIALNDNNTVTTVFPSESVKVKMTTGDFHGLDYNKDLHCVEGEIPQNNHRILLKLHYLAIPPNSENWVDFVRYINVVWTQVSRETMRISANPTNPFEYFIGMLVNISRYIYNNYIFFITIFLILISYMFYYKNINKIIRRFYGLLQHKKN
jgi:hypothetical protein